MSDPLDIASDREQMFRENALRIKKPEGPTPTGFCLWCEEPLANDFSRWCSAEHRDAYEHDMRRRTKR